MMNIVQFSSTKPASENELQSNRNFKKKKSRRRREQKEIGLASRHDSQTAQRPFQQFMKRMSSKKTRQLKILHVCSYIGFSATSKSHSGCPWALELASIPYIHIFSIYNLSIYRCRCIPSLYIIHYIAFMQSFENTCMLLLCFHTYLVIMPQSYLQGTKLRSVSTQVRICLDSSTHDMALSKILWHLAVATNFFSVRGTEDDSSKLQVPRWEFLCLCNFFMRVFIFFAQSERQNYLKTDLSSFDRFHQSCEISNWSKIRCCDVTPNHFLSGTLGVINF